MISRVLLYFLVFTPLAGLAQYANFVIGEDGSSHLALRIEGTNYIYMNGTEEQDIPVREAQSSLPRIKKYIPGFIKIEKSRGTMMTTQVSTSSAPRDFYEIRYQGIIRPNRDLKDVYLMFLWKRGKDDFFKISNPLGDLKEGKTKRIGFYLSVPAAFKNSQYQLLFMSRGIQIYSSEYGKGIATPMEKYLDRTKEVPPLSDSPPKIMSPILPEKPETEDGEPIKGKVVARLAYDENGYVTDVEIISTPHPILAEKCLDVLYSWEIKPQIIEGQPTEGNVQIPLRF